MYRHLVQATIMMSLEDSRYETGMYLSKCALCIDFDSALTSTILSQMHSDKIEVGSDNSFDGKECYDSQVWIWKCRSGTQWKKLSGSRFYYFFTKTSVLPFLQEL
jgi:hypothetical protein